MESFSPLPSAKQTKCSAALCIRTPVISTPYQNIMYTIVSFFFLNFFFLFKAKLKRQPLNQQNKNRRLQQHTFTFTHILWTSFIGLLGLFHPWLLVLSCCRSFTWICIIYSFEFFVAYLPLLRHWLFGFCLKYRSQQAIYGYYIGQHSSISKPSRMT